MSRLNEVFRKSASNAITASTDAYRNFQRDHNVANLFGAVILAANPIARAAALVNIDVTNLFTWLANVHDASSPEGMSQVNAAEAGWPRLHKVLLSVRRGIRRDNQVDSGPRGTGKQEAAMRYIFEHFAASHDHEHLTAKTLAKEIGIHPKTLNKRSWGEVRSTLKTYNDMARDEYPH